MRNRLGVVGLALVVSALFAARASAQESSQPRDMPGACIYKVTVTAGQVEVLHNPAPCPTEIKGWFRTVQPLPPGMRFCGLEIGSGPGDPEVFITPIPCEAPAAPGPTPSPVSPPTSRTQTQS